MRRIDLYTIGHTNPVSSPGDGIVTPFIVGRDDCAGPNIHARTSYAEMRALYWVWRNVPGLDIIGFQQYRRLFNFRGAPIAGTMYDRSGWTSVSVPVFQEYQKWERQWDGALLPDILGHHHIIVPEETPELMREMCSPKDWAIFCEIMAKYGDFDFHMTTGTWNTLFVTTAPVFNEYMKFWWKVTEELAPRLTFDNMPAEYLRTVFPQADDAVAYYSSRMMGYFSERIFSIWLNSSGLKVASAPVMICWDAH